MAKSKRNVGREILEGLRELKRGEVGRVIQDVVTRPTRTWARIQGTGGFVEWHCSGRQA